jgi:selenide, water dikinase
MKNRSNEPDFGATGQFDMTGVFQFDASDQEGFSHTLGMDALKGMVLVGLGLAHRHVLTQLEQHKRKDIDVVLIASDSTFIHPNLLVSWVAGDIPLEKCYTDLRPWILAAGVRWIPGTCIHVDPREKEVKYQTFVPASKSQPDQPTKFTQDSSPIRYDVLSFDDESPNNLEYIERMYPGAKQYALIPEPSMAFIHSWKDRMKHFRQQPPDVIQQICVLGAHRQAIEWALAIEQGLQKSGVTAQITLLTAGKPLGEDLSPALQKRLAQVLTQRGIKVREEGCTRIGPETITLWYQTELPCDLLLICHQRWGHQVVLNSATIDHDKEGRVRVNSKLQSLSHPQIFAVGDSSCLESDSPHQMPSTWDNESIAQLLSLNLMAFLSEQPLSPGQYRQNKPVTVNCSNESAIVQWGPICTESHLAWKLYQKQQQAVLVHQKV